MVDPRRTIAKEEPDWKQYRLLILAKIEEFDEWKRHLESKIDALRELYQDLKDSHTGLKTRVALLIAAGSAIGGGLVSVGGQLLYHYLVKKGP